MVYSELPQKNDLFCLFVLNLSRDLVLCRCREGKAQARTNQKTAAGGLPGTEKMKKYITTTTVYNHPYNGSFTEYQDTVEARDENHACELADKMHKNFDCGFGLSSNAVLFVEDTRTETQRKIDFLKSRLNFRECDRPNGRTIRQWEADLAELESQIS